MQIKVDLLSEQFSNNWIIIGKEFGFFFFFKWICAFQHKMEIGNGKIIHIFWHGKVAFRESINFSSHNFNVEQKFLHEC